MIKLLVDFNTGCSDYAIASSLTLLYNIFKIICVIVPIILILFASIDMTKLVFNPDPKKGITINGIFKKVIATIIIFIVPNLINIIVNFYSIGTNSNANYSIAACFNNSETSAKTIEKAVYKEGAGTEKGSGLSGMFGDLSGLKNYQSSSGSSGVAGEGAQRLINVAKKELGNNESDGTHMKYENYMGFGRYDPWCAMFVSWCANEAGYIESGIIPKYASCSVGVEWFRNKNAFHTEGSGYTPQPGDIVFFGPGGGSHTGIVVSSDANNVYTIEGNTGNDSHTNTSDMVSERTRPRATGYVYGYGTPAY